MLSTGSWTERPACIDSRVSYCLSGSVNVPHDRHPERNRRTLWNACNDGRPWLQEIEEGFIIRDAQVKRRRELLPLAVNAYVDRLATASIRGDQAQASMPEGQSGASNDGRAGGVQGVEKHLLKFLVANSSLSVMLAVCVVFLLW